MIEAEEETNTSVSLATKNSQLFLLSLFRSKNASLILTCGFQELDTLCNLSVRSPKWPPRLIFAGACACHGKSYTKHNTIHKTQLLGIERRNFHNKKVTLRLLTEEMNIKFEV